MDTQNEPTDSPHASKPTKRQRPGTGLYVVATPIGNLSDIGSRAVETLATADVIACEDRRVSAKLLRAHGISTPTISYHDHNASRMRPAIIERLKKGQVVALISDAGTPLISDPGYKLVRAARDARLPVYTVPGPSAPVAALSISGLPTDRFYFGGFPPPKPSARRAMLSECAALSATWVFFESGRRLTASLADMAQVFGAREAVVARELTKLHEEIRRGSLVELAEAYRREESPKGEIVVLIAGATARDEQVSQAALDEHLRTALATMSVRDAAASVATATGTSRGKVYKRALELAKENLDDLNSSDDR